MSVSETEALRLSRPITYPTQRPPDYRSLSILLNQINDMKNELNVLSRIVTKLECQVPLRKKTEMDSLFKNPIGYSVTLTTQTSPKNTYVRQLKVPESQKSFKVGSSYKILNHRDLNFRLENNSISENLEKLDTGNKEKHSYETLESFFSDRSRNNNIIEGEKTLSFPSLRKDFEGTSKDKYEEKMESSLSDHETHFMPTYISALKVVTSRPPNTKRAVEFGERSTSKSYFDFADYYLKILDLHDKATKKQKSTTPIVSTSG